MKEIKAVIRPARLGPLRVALRRIAEFPGMTVIPCEGMTAPKRLPKQTDPLVDFSKKVLIVIVSLDHMVEPIVQTITANCATGNVGDGVIWVSQLDNFRHIKEGVEDVRT